MNDINLNFTNLLVPLIIGLVTPILTFLIAVKRSRLDGTKISTDYMTSDRTQTWAEMKDLIASLSAENDRVVRLLSESEKRLKDELAQVNSVKEKEISAVREELRTCHENLLTIVNKIGG